MVIDVSQQLKEPIGALRNYRVSGRDHPFSGEVSLLRTDRGILLRGALETTVEAVCSRCLSPFEQPLTLNIEEEYLLTVDPLSGTSLPSVEDGAFTIDEGQEIDLDELVRQYSVLALPIKPLCREDCAGLCPTCGHNLNLGPCDCPHGAPDPRFALLARLLAEERGG
jgi:uncharacterized protein